MSDKYILDGQTPILMDDLVLWAIWVENSDKHIAQDEIGDVRINTVFLGLDHSSGVGEPLLFETMIFGGEHGGYQDRCSTWAQAQNMHAKALAKVRAST